MDDHQQRMQEHFEHSATTVDQWRRRNLYYHQDLEKLYRFLVPPGLRVLEVGCGTGHLLAALHPSVGIGIDYAPSMIAQAEQCYPHLHFYCLDAGTVQPHDLDPEHRHVDVIILSDLLGYLTDIQGVLNTIRTFCHPQTRVILTFHNFLWEPLLNLAERMGQRRPQPPQNWLSMADTLNMLTITGYVPLKQGRRFIIPKRLSLLSDWMNRYVSQWPIINHLGLTQYIVARPVSAPRDPQTVSCSIIVAARNEAGNIAPLMARCPVFGRHTELIFVEGHSQDETWNTIQHEVKNAPISDTFSVAAYQQTGKGKGDAVRLGFEKARGDVLMILDADLTVQPEDLRHFWDVILAGYGEFINGSRLVYPHSQQAMPWLNRVANKFFALMFSYLLEKSLKDTLCGTKVLWKQDYERIAAGRSYFGDFDPFGDFDLLFGATRLSLDIVEVPVRYQPRSYGQSNIAHVKEGLILLKMCVYASRKIRFF